MAKNHAYLRKHTSPFTRINDIITFGIFEIISNKPKGFAAFNSLLKTPTMVFCNVNRCWIMIINYKNRDFFKSYNAINTSMFLLTQCKHAHVMYSKIIKFRASQS